MDVFSHWLWGVLITRRHVNWKVAGPMSVLPDLLAFVPSFVYSTMHGLERPTVEDTTVTSDFPAIAWDMYQYTCLLYTSPSPRDRQKSRMPSSA